MIWWAPRTKAVLDNAEPFVPTVARIVSDGGLGHNFGGTAGDIRQREVAPDTERLLLVGIDLERTIGDPLGFATVVRPKQHRRRLAV